jgi:hypothetical protein
MSSWYSFPFSKFQYPDALASAPCKYTMHSTIPCAFWTFLITCSLFWGFCWLLRWSLGHGWWEKREQIQKRVSLILWLQRVKVNVAGNLDETLNPSFFLLAARRLLATMKPTHVHYFLRSRIFTECLRYLSVLHPLWIKVAHQTRNGLLCGGNSAPRVGSFVNWTLWKTLLVCISTTCPEKVCEKL